MECPGKRESVKDPQLLLRLIWHGAALLLNREECVKLPALFDSAHSVSDTDPDPLGTTLSQELCH